jgi:hypothetical protein
MEFMLTKASRHLTIFIAAILLPAAAVAQSTEIANDSETYDKIHPAL